MLVLGFLSILFDIINGIQYYFIYEELNYALFTGLAIILTSCMNYYTIFLLMQKKKFFKKDLDKKL